MSDDNQGSNIERNTAPALNSEASAPSSNNPPSATTPSVDVSGAKAYARSLQFDHRFATTNARLAGTIIQVKLNFAQFRERVEYMLTTAYLNWPSLRNLVAADAYAIDAYITKGCRELSISSVYSLYNHLRIVTSTVAPQLYPRYRTNPPQSRYRSLPVGLLTIVQQFGLSGSVEFWENPRFLHVWDKEHEKKFGLPGNPLNDPFLTGFLTLLEKAGVKFTKMPSSPPVRSLWDSLTVDIKEDSFFVFTTYPIHEYDVPQDIFFACGFRPTQGTYESVISNYAPRIQAIGDDNAGLITTKVTSAATPTAKAKTAAGICKVNYNDLYPMNSFQNVSRSGVVVYGDPADPNSRTLDVYIFGRGNNKDNMNIRSIARGVYQFEVDNFFTALLRHGL